MEIDYLSIHIGLIALLKRNQKSDDKPNPHPAATDEPAKYKNMALKTDDCDLRDVRFYMDMGGNGDFYINLVEYPCPECASGSDVFKSINYRMAMSGGFASRHPDVREAFVNLYRAMEKAGLNEHPNG